MKFCCYYHFINFYCLSLGVHVCLKPLNFEIHLPFGFCKIGFDTIIPYYDWKKHTWGIDPPLDGSASITNRKR
jgi:hypothetical protein